MNKLCTFYAYICPLDYLNSSNFTTSVSLQYTVNNSAFKLQLQTFARISRHEGH